MMDEILLTPEEMVDAGLDGARKFADAICVYSYKTGLRQKRGKVPNRELYIREEVCRAQVKKVVEWIEERNQAHGVWSAPGEPRASVHLYLNRSDWQALREAAGGEG